MGLTDSNGGLSAADVAAVMNGNGGGNGWGFGGDGAWWLLVLFLFAFNGNGWGNGGGGGGFTPYAVDNSVQRGFDQSAIMAGISGVQTAITNGFSDAAIAQCNQTTSMLQSLNGLGAQMQVNEMARQQCCCDTKQAIADLKYTVATEACADRNAISMGVRDIIDNQTRGFQLIQDKLCQQEIDALKTQNANLQTQLNMQNLATSQATQTAQLIQDNNAQTAALINRIAPYPVPSYNVANPYSNQGCGCYSNSCGCGANV